MARDRSGLYAAAAMLAAAVLLVSATAGAEPGDLTAHWSRPVRASGGDFFPGPSALRPQRCARCHNDKYTDWSASMHALSTGPGLIAQLDPPSEPGFASSCYFCHAPLIEQAEFLDTEDRHGDFLKNQNFDPALKASGVSCAACHVRGGVAYGPPAPNVRPTETGHRSAEREFFGTAEFCAACHQLDDGVELNGKLLVNTYGEWSESRYAEAGVTCQNCHMSGRRHLFRGIHDPEMTRSAVEIDAAIERTGQGVTARLRITNTGAGHYFPTYVTPEVRLGCYLAGPGGTVITGSRREHVVARRVTVDLTHELFDTRIPPAEASTLSCAYDRVPEGAVYLVFDVMVLPDEFYNRFFSGALKEGHSTARQRVLEMALAKTERSPYVLYRREFPLDEIKDDGKAAEWQ